MSGTTEVLRRLLADGSLELPLPARGDTPERLHRLCELTRVHSVSVGRLAEAHTDVVAILAEADRTPQTGALYGVWASGGAHGPAAYDARSSSLSGTKPLCSGLGTVDRSLLTVDEGGPTLLADVDVRPAASLRWSTASWRTQALAATGTGTGTGEIVVDRHPVSSGGIVGPPGWYVDRPGFWHGSCGPAARWAGGAIALVDHADELGTGVDAAARGELRAAEWGLRAVLEVAGTETDAHPSDTVLAPATGP